MKLEIYSIYDHASKAYMTPFFMQNKGMAIRSFQGTVNPETPNMVSQNPEQFTLFKLGDYDDSNGKVECLDTPEPILKAQEIHEPQLNRDQIMETLMTLVDKVTNLERISNV